MAILNYTTRIDPAKTINEISMILSKAGATAIMTTLSEGKPVGVKFSINTPYGPRTFTLPVDPKKVYRVLMNENVERKFKTPEQAERIAWRIVKDWLEAQMAILHTEMVTLEQVMLPYMHSDDGRTVYDLYADQQLALSTPTS